MTKNDKDTSQTSTGKTKPKKKKKRLSSLIENTYSGLISDVTNAYLDDYDQSSNLTPQELACEIVNQCNTAITSHNVAVEKPLRWKNLSDLTPQQIAICMSRLDNVSLVSLTDKESSSDLASLAIYETSGPNKGIYSADDDELATIARNYNFNISRRDFDEIKAALRSIVPKRSRNSNENYVPVNNGIFDYSKKVLLPFSPDIVFMSKSHVDYVENAPNPKLHNDNDGTDWDVISWMNSLSDDKEVVTFLWQVLGAIIRPNVPWDHAAWLYSTRGNNGKGTLCELMRNLCGPGSYAKISLRDFSGNDFLLEPLVHASAIIVDENDVGTYIDKAANLKAVETGDVITINRKFKSPISYQFKGFMVQCLNEFPKVRDRSGSFYRRQIFVPMTKNFQGKERRYIKQDYLNRTDVLEYVLFHILKETNYYALSIPSVCDDLMDEYQAFNDPIRQFISEILPECQWDLLPFKFLYDLYRAWFAKNVPNGTAVSKNSFISELHDIFDGTVSFGFTANGTNQIWTGNKMSKAEPLIEEYNLKDWINKNVSGSDSSRRTIPDAAQRYRGLVRAS